MGLRIFSMIARLLLYNDHKRAAVGCSLFLVKDHIKKKCIDLLRAG